MHVDAQNFCVCLIRKGAVGGRLAEGAPRVGLWSGRIVEMGLSFSLCMNVFREGGGWGS